MNLGLDKHLQTRLPSCMENFLNCEKRNGNILAFSFCLLKFIQLLECFLILPDLWEGLPCVRSFGDVPSAAQWYSKGFPPAVAAAGLGRQRPKLIRRGEESRDKELRREAYKYCMAAALLLPEPSYHCCSALCKNVTSLHCSALNRVEITNCTLFGLAWAYPGVL